MVVADRLDPARSLERLDQLPAHARFERLPQRARRPHDRLRQERRVHQRLLALAEIHVVGGLGIGRRVEANLGQLERTGFGASLPGRPVRAPPATAPAPPASARWLRDACIVGAWPRRPPSPPAWLSSTRASPDAPTPACRPSPPPSTSSAGLRAPIAAGGPVDATDSAALAPPAPQSPATAAVLMNSRRFGIVSFPAGWRAASARLNSAEHAPDPRGL